MLQMKFYGKVDAQFEVHQSINNLMEPKNEKSSLEQSSFGLSDFSWSYTFVLTHFCTNNIKCHVI